MEIGMYIPTMHYQNYLLDMLQNQDVVGSEWVYYVMTSIAPDGQHCHRMPFLPQPWN